MILLMNYKISDSNQASSVTDLEGIICGCLSSVVVAMYTSSVCACMHMRIRMDVRTRNYIFKVNY